MALQPGFCFARPDTPFCLNGENISLMCLFHSDNLFCTLSLLPLFFPRAYETLTKRASAVHAGCENEKKKLHLRQSRQADKLRL